MPDQSLPGTFVVALSALHEADEGTFEAILGATEVLLEPSGMSDFGKSVATSTGLDEQEAAAMLNVLQTIVRGLIAAGRNQDGPIAELVSAPELGLDEPSQEQLANRIKAVASRRPLQVLAKSFGLLRTQERLILDARILTDIKPIFGDEVSEEPEAAILAYSLKIDFLRAGERESIDMALEHIDLLDIRQEVDDAIAKSTSLRRMLKSVDISSPVL